MTDRTHGALGSQDGIIDEIAGLEVSPRVWTQYLRDAAGDAWEIIETPWGLTESAELLGTTIVLDDTGWDPALDHSGLLLAQAHVPDWKHPIPNPDPFSRGFSSPPAKTRARLRARRKKR